MTDSPVSFMVGECTRLQLFPNSELFLVDFSIVICMFQHDCVFVLTQELSNHCSYLMKIQHLWNNYIIKIIISSSKTIPSLKIHLCHVHMRTRYIFLSSITN